MSMWNPTLVATSLNLRIERGHEASDYRLSGDVARAQLQFCPDFICNYEDMEGCASDEYDGMLAAGFVRIAATDDRQGRGVSCWVKRGYAVRFSLFTGPYNRKGFIAVTCKLNSISSI